MLGIDVGGDQGGEYQNHVRQAHGMPTDGQAAREEIPKGESTALATGAEPSQYLDVKNAIKKWGTGSKDSVTRDLKWQQDMDGRQKKQQRLNKLLETSMSSALSFL